MKSIHFRVNNTTALRYLQKMGKTRNIQLIESNKEIQEYLLLKGFAITAKYLPNVVSTEADKALRQEKESSKWKLNSQIFLANTRHPRGRRVRISSYKPNSKLHYMETIFIKPEERGNARGLKGFCMPF